MEGQWVLSETIEDQRRARADVIIMTFCPGPNRGRKSYRKKVVNVT